MRGEGRVQGGQSARVTGARATVHHCTTLHHHVTTPLTKDTATTSQQLSHNFMLWCLEDIQALISTIQFCNALEYPPHLLDDARNNICSLTVTLKDFSMEAEICTFCFVSLSLVFKRLI